MDGLRVIICIGELNLFNVYVTTDWEDYAQGNELEARRSPSQHPIDYGEPIIVAAPGDGKESITDY